MQKLKDTFLLLGEFHLYSDAFSFDSLTKIEEEIRGYVELFSSIFSKLNDVERKMLHSMKNQLYKIEQDISMIKNKKPDSGSPFLLDLVCRLTQARMDLTNLQQLLLSRRQQ